MENREKVSSRLGFILISAGLIIFPASKVYRFYLTYILPIVIAFIMIMAYVTLFK